MPKAFEARKKLRRLRTPALRTDTDQRDKCDSRRPQPQRLNKGTKKEVIASIKIRLCVLHSGAAARIRPAESGHRGQQGLVRTDRSDSKVTNLRKNPQDPSQQKEKHFSASNYPPDKTRGKETRLPDHHNKQGNFSSSSPPLRSSPRHPIRSHPIAAHTHARARVRAFSRFSIIAFTVHRLSLFLSICDD